MQGRRCGPRNKWEGGNAGATRKTRRENATRSISWLTGIFHVLKFNQSAVTTSLAFSHATLNVTWDQAQFERFSYILSNGYRENWASLFVSPCPPECNFQSETKIEPDLRLLWMTVCWFCSLLFTLVEFVLQRKSSTQNAQDARYWAIEVNYERTRKNTQRKGQLCKDFFVFWTLKQTFLEFDWF